MKIMAAHEIWSLGQASAGTVDGPSYDETDLVKANSDTVRTPGSSASFSIPLIGGGQTNGIAIINHSLAEDATAVFSGLGTVTGPPVPPSGVRDNAWTTFDAVATPGSTTMTVADAGVAAFIAQLVVVGLFREARTPPPDGEYGFKMLGIPSGSELPGFNHSRGARSRSYGGTMLCTRAERDVFWKAFDASDDGSLPTIITVDNEREAWLVKWTTFNPRIRHGGYTDVFPVECMWDEIRRLRHPV